MVYLQLMLLLSSIHDIQYILLQHKHYLMLYLLLLLLQHLVLLQSQLVLSHHLLVLELDLNLLQWLLLLEQNHLYLMFYQLLHLRQWLLSQQSMHILLLMLVLKVVLFQVLSIMFSCFSFLPFSSSFLLFHKKSTEKIQQLYQNFSTLFTFIIYFIRYLDPPPIRTFVYGI